MAKGSRELVKLFCTTCGEENYHTTKNKKTHTEKLEVNKFCPREQKYTIHREKK
jgi:large subunit ribosomal protein L33